uniref:Uncharacterized protein n=1 Tax=Romanomermis culicivorax TaxID=13658 RepID=A0A915K3J6_ROMCU
MSLRRIFLRLFSKLPLPREESL